MKQNRPRGAARIQRPTVTAGTPMLAMSWLPEKVDTGSPMSDHV
jgi:hypothetical protein